MLVELNFWKNSDSSKVTPVWGLRWPRTTISATNAPRMTIHATHVNGGILNAPGGFFWPRSSFLLSLSSSISLFLPVWGQRSMSLPLSQQAIFLYNLHHANRF